MLKILVELPLAPVPAPLVCAVSVSILHCHHYEESKMWSHVYCHINHKSHLMISIILFKLSN